MPSYLGPERLAVFSATAYSVPQPSLTPIPPRSIPVSSGLHYARSAPNPTRLPDGPQTPAVFASLQPSDSRHLRNIIQPLLCDCPSGLPPGRGSAHTAHNPDYVKYLPPPPSRKWTRTEPLYLRTRVSTFSKERAECRPRHPPIWLSASPISVSGQRLRPLPTTGAHRLRLPPLQSPPHQPHHTRNCLSCGHADSVQPRLKCST